MRDLLVITPTRGRPGSAQRLIAAVDATATAVTDLLLAIDDDDPSYEGLDITARSGALVIVVRGPRATCPQWSNQAAAQRGFAYRALASLGDDHVPRTHGWDSALLAAIDGMGGHGIAYGDDTLQHENLPTAPVVSSSIVAALGWFFLPGLTHYFADNVWLDLGREAGCLAYRPDVVIEHMHYTAGKSARDAAYADAESAWGPDEAAYRAWRRDGLAADAAKVRTLREASP